MKRGALLYAGNILIEHFSSRHVLCTLTSNRDRTNSFIFLCKMSLLRFGFTKRSRSGERGTEEAAEKSDSDQSADVGATDNRLECDSNTDSDTAAQNQSKQKTKHTKTIARKYNPDYLKYGFA